MQRVPFRIMTEKNRSANGFFPFLLGVGVMAIAAAVFYFFTQRQATAPTVAPVANAPTTVAPASPSPQAPAPSDSLPPAPTVNLQVNHPNGSTARLTQLTLAEDSITASLSVTNGYKEAIKLNRSDDLVITDNFGNQYNLAAPPENAEINIAPGTTLKGQFVFKGRLAPNVSALTLTTNKKFGSDATFSRTPKLVFNIPLQGGTK
jgi:hypothetical protein